MIQWYQIFKWPEENLRRIGYAAGGGVVLLAVSNFFTPNVEPLYPAELSQPGVDESAPDWPTAATKDFILRPLFSAARRPEAPVIIEEVAPPPIEAIGAVSLEGISLLGVFGSSGKGGVILELEDSTRTRLYVGEQLNGWTLTDTHLRTAIFTSSSGSETELSLALASTLPALQRRESAPTNPVSGSDGAPAGSGEVSEPEGEYIGPVTFGSIDDQKRKEVESRMKNAADE